MFLISSSSFFFFKLAITLVARKVGHKWNSLAAEAGWCLLSLVKPLQDLQTFLSHAVKTKKQKNKKTHKKKRGFACCSQNLY